jgi:hypothetical protein
VAHGTTAERRSGADIAGHQDRIVVQSEDAGSGIVTGCAELLGARDVAGFVEPGDRDIALLVERPWGRALNHRWPESTVARAPHNRLGCLMSLRMY